ncbi:sensor histidine kinase [Gordonia iterans]
MSAAARVSLTADRYIQWGGHLLFAVLMGVGLARALVDARGPAVAVVAGAAAVSAWYLFGVAAISLRHKQIQTPWTVVLVAGWAALTLWSPAFVWPAFVLAMLCWHFLPRSLAVAFELLIVSVSVLASLRGDTVGVGAVIGPVIGIATAIAVTEAVHRIVDAAAERAALSRELGLLAERERLGTQIHDGAGQALAGIVMLLQSAADPSTAPAQRHAQTATALEMASAALTQTRMFLRGLDGGEVPDGPLTVGLQSAVAKAARLGLPTELHVHGALDGLDDEAGALLLRAAQEALANAVRHAGATRAVVTLTALGDEAHLDVVDDGVGFSPARADGGTGFGLRALATRAERCRGALTVDSEPGDGTTIHVCVPLSDPALPTEAPPPQGGSA